MILRLILVVFGWRVDIDLVQGTKSDSYAVVDGFSKASGVMRIGSTDRAGVYRVSAKQG